MQYPLAQLAALCEAHPIQPKILFVPNMQAGYDLTTALAAAKIAWVNLHITTPQGLAEQEVGPQLHSQNWKHLPRDADLFFLEDLLAEALKADPDGYFARATTGPGLTRSFLRTLHAMRIAGIDPDHIQPTNSNKHRLLETLYQSYTARLETDRTYDNATLFREALRRQDKPPSEAICFAILDETPLGALAYQYLQKRTGNILYRIGRPDYGLPPPVQSAAARFPDAPFPETTSFPIGIGGHLLTRGLTPEDCATIHLKETLGTETEVHTILRDIQHRNLSLDTVEIVYTTDTPYLTLLRDTVERFELPATFAAGVPIH
ncbi:MAG: hypothetical protein O7G87_17230 [bacterium]|nr:hypothetical protein [bacterium]